MSWGCLLGQYVWRSHECCIDCALNLATTSVDSVSLLKFMTEHEAACFVGSTSSDHFGRQPTSAISVRSRLVKQRDTSSGFMYQTLRRVRYLIYDILYSNINYGPTVTPRYSWAGRDQTNQIKGSKTGNQVKRPETRHRTTQGNRLDTLLVAGHGVPLAIRTAGQPVT